MLSVADSVAGQACTVLKYLPFPRNRQFFGRTTELEAIERTLFVEQDCQQVAVVGLGGIGKMQVALRFAHTVVETRPELSVFWVPATSMDAFEQAYGEIAKRLGIRDGVDGKEDVKEAVRGDLDGRTGGKWLLVVDNADDMQVLEGDDGRAGLLEYLPEGDSGRIIFTAGASRSRSRL